MRDTLLVLAGALGLLVVELFTVVWIAVQRVRKGLVNGPNSRERMKETVVPVLKQE